MCEWGQGAKHMRFPLTSREMRRHPRLGTEATYLDISGIIPETTSNRPQAGAPERDLRKQSGHRPADGTQYFKW